MERKGGQGDDLTGGPSILGDSWRARGGDGSGHPAHRASTRPSDHSSNSSQAVHDGRVRDSRHIYRSDRRRHEGPRRIVPSACPTCHPYTDPETGYVYLRNRYYDPATAQFLTRDPLDAATRSAYGYGGNDPLDQSDPLGLCSWTSWSCDKQSVVNVAGGTLNAITFGHAKGVLNAVKKNNANSVNWNSDGATGARDTVGVGLGVAAAFTGVGALAETDELASLGLGLKSFGLGVAASGLDYGPCRGGDHAACAGLALGASGAFAGGIGAVGTFFAVGGSTAAALFDGLAVLGLSGGYIGTLIDAINLFDPGAFGPSCGSSG